MPRKKKTGKQKEKKKVKAIMKTMFYEPSLTRVGRTVIKVYQPLEDASSIEEIEISTSREVLSALEERMERARKEASKMNADKSFMEISIEGKGFALHKGEYRGISAEPKEKMLFPRPARLRALGLLKKEGEIEWLRQSFRKELYVYEGEIEYPKDYIGVILDTEYGRRVYR